MISLHTKVLVREPNTPACNLMFTCSVLCTKPTYGNEHHIMVSLLKPHPITKVYLQMAVPLSELGLYGTSTILPDYIKLLCTVLYM